MHPRHRHIAAVTAALLLSGSTGDSFARAAPRVEWSGPVELIAEDHGGHFDVNAFKAHTTLIWVPRGIEDFSYPLNLGFDVRRMGDHRLYITIAANTPTGTEAGLRVWSMTPGFEFSLHLRASDQIRGNEDSYVVKRASDKRAELLFANTPGSTNNIQYNVSSLAQSSERAPVAHTPTLPPPIALTDTVTGTVTDTATEDVTEDVAEDIIDASIAVAEARTSEHRRPRLHAILDVLRLSHASMEITLDHSEWLPNGRDLFIKFQATNRAMQPVPFLSAHASDREGRALDMHLVVGGEHVYPNNDRASLPLLRVAQTVSGGLVIKRAASRDLEDMSVEFHSVQGSQKLVTAGRITRFRSVPDGDLEHERQDREARGRVTIQLQPMYGAMWLANPLDEDELGVTSVKGLSMRVRYGINRLFGLEGEIAGASSNNARFANMTYQGMEGELARHVSLGRVQLGAIATLGYKYIPTVRVALGFQASHYSTRFVPDTGGDMTGPDEGFKADALFSFGAGLDIRLSKHWKAGIGASFIGVAKSLGTAGLGGSLEAGLHIGYGWTPGGVIKSEPFPIVP